MEDTGGSGACNRVNAEGSVILVHANITQYIPVYNCFLQSLCNGLQVIIPFIEKESPRIDTLRLT